MKAVQDIDALLPQTQCGECGYPGCLPYAEAIASGQATIDRCPPGGLSTLNALGQLLHIDTSPYLAKVAASTRPAQLAYIREAECIGCTKCIQACPVDAIIGSAKQLHHILSHECTGCGLCIEPCPVDCIEMHPLEKTTYASDLARQRFQQKKIRQLQEVANKERAYREKKRLTAQTAPSTADIKAKQDYIQDALTRVKGRQRQQ